MKKYTLKPDYSEYTVGQYIDYTNNTGNILNQVIAITGMERDEAVKLTPAQMNQIVAYFEDVLNTKQTNFKYFWNCAGVKYGFIPNIESVTFAEWLDLNSCLSTYPATMDKMLSILYRPVTAEFMEKYKIEEYSSDIHISNKRKMRSMPLDVANGCMLFFSTIKNELWINFQEYLDKQMNRNIQTAITTMKEVIQQ